MRWLLTIVVHLLLLLAVDRHGATTMENFTVLIGITVRQLFDSLCDHT